MNQKTSMLVGRKTTLQANYHPSDSQLSKISAAYKRNSLKYI